MPQNHDTNEGVSEDIKGFIHHLSVVNIPTILKNSQNNCVTGVFTHIPCYGLFGLKGIILS